MIEKSDDWETRRCSLGPAQNRNYYRLKRYKGRVNIYSEVCFPNCSKIIAEKFKE